MTIAINSKVLYTISARTKSDTRTKEQRVIPGKVVAFYGEKMAVLEVIKGHGPVTIRAELKKLTEVEDEV